MIINESDNLSINIMPKTSDKILDILYRLEKKIDNLEKVVKELQSGNNNVKKTPKKRTIKKKIVIKTGNVILTRHPNGIIISGDTYDKRAIIKKFSGWWTPEYKGWTVRANKYEAIKEELNSSSKTLTEKISDKNLKIDDLDNKNSNVNSISENNIDIDLPDNLDFISDED